MKFDFGSSGRENLRRRDKSVQIPISRDPRSYCRSEHFSELNSVWTRSRQGFPHKRFPSLPLIFEVFSGYLDTSCLYISSAFESLSLSHSIAKTWSVVVQCNEIPPLERKKVEKEMEELRAILASADTFFESREISEKWMGDEKKAPRRKLCQALFSWARTSPLAEIFLAQTESKGITTLEKKSGSLPIECNAMIDGVL